ncbi:methyl-accepting chemotaxis protein [Rhizorhabdus phycosphaerae]|uniref:methyl-accepting chemotaxis protein n=1 Tax=Rhizorhabdus phycosphaerae TaxID=2711156 RepID=UPI0013EACEB5|nr:methyl-accepting chemotaxis protein [Rhizorhabdus phycosphaerae]
MQELEMIRWFVADAPIRLKFNIIAMVNASIAATGLAALLLSGSAPMSLETVAVATIGATIAGFTFLFKKLICDPYVTTVVRMEALAEGDLDSEVRFTQHRDCVGRMTTAMSAFRDNALQVQRAAEAEHVAREAQRTVIGALAGALGALASGDLTTRLNEPFPEDYEELRQHFNEAIASLDEALSATSDATRGVHTGAQEIQKASDELARRTEMQAANLEEAAASVGLITSTVAATSADAARADAAVEQAREEATHGSQIARDAVEAMSSIQNASREIAKIINVIDGIAFQTNLLALNAGVEAARAGDSGRGFAVVASEVRALAQRAADAAKDIAGRINGSVTEVASGVQLVTAAGASLQTISAKIADVSELVSAIARAAESQSASLGQVNAAVLELDQVTQQNAAMVEEATAAASSLNDEAGSLMGTVSRFQVGTQQARKLVARNASPVRPPLQLAAVGRRGSAAPTEDWHAF